MYIQITYICVYICCVYILILSQLDLGQAVQVQTDMIEQLFSTENKTDQYPVSW